MRFAACLLPVIVAIAPACAVARAPTKISYSEARRTGGSYECSYGLPSFFGESAPFRSQIRGDDVHTVHAIALDPRSDDFLGASSRPFEELARSSPVHYWRIGGFGYRWIPQGDPAIKFDLAALAAVAPGGAAAVEGDFFLAPVPPGDASCIPVQRATFELPKGVVFTDVTKQMIEDTKQRQDRP